MRAISAPPARRPRPLRLVVPPGVHPVDPYAARFAAAMRLGRGERVLDLGCGAGGYGLAAAARGAGAVVATDVDPDAVRATLANAARHGLARVVQGRTGPLFAPVRGERFDVIVATLPQLPAPGRVIATRWGGRDGLRLLRPLAARAAAHLEPGGRVYALVTDWADPRSVEPLFAAQGFAVRRVARAERAFQPCEYDALSPGLFAYLDARARAGRGRYRRKGSWCYLGISFLEATICFTPAPSPGSAPTARPSPP